MRKITLLFIFSILFVLPVFAHAGMYDRFLDIMVSYRAMLAVVLFTHLSCFLCAKYVKCAFIYKLKVKIMRLIKKLQRNEITMYSLSWLLCSFVYGVYLILISGQIFFWALGIPLIIFFFVIFLWTFRKKWREKYLWGARVLFCYTQSSVFIVIGLLFYSILSQLSFFKRIFSYTDEEYQLANFYIYPCIEGIFSLCENIIICSFIFIIPYLTFGAYRTLVNLYNRINK